MPIVDQETTEFLEDLTYSITCFVHKSSLWTSDKDEMVAFGRLHKECTFDVERVRPKKKAKK